MLCAHYIIYYCETPLQNVFFVVLKKKKINKICQLTRGEGNGKFRSVQGFIIITIFYTYTHTTQYTSVYIHSVLFYQMIAPREKFYSHYCNAIPGARLNGFFFPRRIQRDGHLTECLHGNISIHGDNNATVHRARSRVEHPLNRMLYRRAVLNCRAIHRLCCHNFITQTLETK